MRTATKPDDDDNDRVDGNDGVKYDDYTDFIVLQRAAGPIALLNQNEI